MKRAAYYNPKDIRIEDIPIPEPGEGEIIIKNKVALTCGTDVKTYMRGYPEDIMPFGHEASGTVYAVGSNVSKFKVGDRVVAHNSAPCQKCYYCKRGIHSMCEDLLFNMGAFTEYQKIPKRIVNQNVFKIPDDMTFEQAALLEPFSCAVFGVDSIDARLSDTVVVNGAGPIGLMFVALLANRGVKVISTDLSDVRLACAKKLGAKYTVNASQGDVVESVRALTEDGRGCDISVEATGLVDVWEKNILMTRKGGTALMFGGTKSGATLNVDTSLLHYSQLTVMGLFHTTPRHVSMAFDLLKQNIISEKDFVTGEFKLEEVEKAILNHSEGKGVKNKIVF